MEEKFIIDGKIHYKYKGEYRTIAYISEDTGIREKILRSRLDDLDWSLEKAVSTPVKKKPYNQKYLYRGKYYTIKELAKISEIGSTGIYSRIKKYGFSVEDAVEKPNMCRSAKKYKYKNELLTVVEIEKKYGILKSTFNHRINNGWSIEKAIETPARPKDDNDIVGITINENNKDWEEWLNTPVSVILDRIEKNI